MTSILYILERPNHIKISVSPLMGIELGGHMVVRAWVVEYKDQARAS